MSVMSSQITGNTRVCLTTHLLSIEGPDWPKLHDLYKAHDAKTYQYKFRYGKGLWLVCALSLLFINIFFTMLLFALKADAWLKQNMSLLVALLICSILRWKKIPAQNRTN